MSLTRRSVAVTFPTSGSASSEEHPPRGGLIGLLETLRNLHAHDVVGVLGIVYAATGSTYQKPGAMVMLDAQGMRHGAISGGCLEPELEERARKVLTQQSAQIIDFDTRSDEDLVFGSGTGCRGRIHLMLIPQPSEAPLAQALARLAQGSDRLTLELVTQGDYLGSGTATLGDEAWSWDSAGRAHLSTWPDPDTVLNIEPPPHILLFGAGPETPPLYLFMRRLGWRVTVFEHRGRWLKFALAAGVEHVVELPPDEAAAVWSTTGAQADAGIAMTHNYALDLAHLRFCARSSLAYIGLLGPAARRQMLFEELGGELVGLLGDRLRSPVGLGLGGSGPEPLAVSIVAELQQHLARRGRCR